MAAFRTFYQRVMDPGAWRRSGRNANVWASSDFFVRPLGASIATFGLLCAAAPVVEAANFTCSWNDAAANWATVVDWSTCNSTFPNNVGGNTYDATISQGGPTLTTAITIGNVTVNSGGTLGLSGGTIIDATLAGAGTMQTNTTGTLNAVTISSGSTYTSPNGTITNLVGTITNQGTIQLNGAAGIQGFLNLAGNVTLTGGGTVAMIDTSGTGNAFFTGNGQTL